MLSVDPAIGSSLSLEAGFQLAKRLRVTTRRDLCTPCGPAIMERLEDRTLFHTVVGGPGPIIPPGPPPVISPTDLTVEPHRIETGTLPSDGSTAYYVGLNKGDYLALTVSPAAQDGLASSSLTVDEPNGTVVAQASASPDPSTGAFTNNAALGFTAPASGLYAIALSTTSAGGAYALDMHRIVLASGTQNPADLETPGSMYAALVGNQLQITGPTGYGFAIQGNWSQSIVTTTRYSLSPFGPVLVDLFASTFTSSGPLQLVTAEGDLPLSVAQGQAFSVSTLPSTFGNVFGVVKSVGADLGLPLGNYATSLRQKLGLNLNIDSLANDWTIQLGSTPTLQHHGGTLPMLGGVPYLYYSGPATMSVAFGQANITENSPAPLVAFADPADPSICVQYDGFTVEGSLNGLIPYTPAFGAAAAAAPGFGTFFGNVYSQGGFQLGDLPIDVTGQITVNLDPRQEGVWLGGAGTASQLFQGKLLQGATLNSAMNDIEVGATGTASVGYDLHGFDLTIPVAAKSFVYNGVVEGAYVDGTTVSKQFGTPLGAFQPFAAEVVQGYVYRSGSYELQLSDTYEVLGAAANLNLNLGNEELFGGIDVEGTVDAFGTAVHVAGGIQSNGDFKLTGNLDATFGAFSGLAAIELSDAGGVASISGLLQGSLFCSEQIAGTTVQARGTLDASLSIAYDGGNANYTGSATCTGDISDGQQRLAFNVDGTVSNNEIDLSLPVFGTELIELLA